MICCLVTYYMGLVFSLLLFKVLWKDVGTDPTKIESQIKKLLQVCWFNFLFSPITTPIVLISFMMIPLKDNLFQDGLLTIYHYIFNKVKWATYPFVWASYLLFKKKVDDAKVAAL